MIEVSNVSLQFGGRVLFKDVNLKFTKGNCYGIIGANGAGKSTFLRILDGEIEPNSGEVIISKDERLSVLKQNQNAYDDYDVITTVLMGYKKLYDTMIEKDALYNKPDFNEQDGMKAGELESLYAEMGGYEAESNIENLLSGLDIGQDKCHLLMKDLDPKEKVKILLAQALFGNPDILILDEPTNNLDIKTVRWLENFLLNFENTVIVVSHNRHFLNKVCTNICDVDYGQITMFMGNYDFWYETSQLLLKQQKEENKKKEQRASELKDFIARFAANASKSKQATSRKKELEKLTIDDIKPSSRKYPFIDFRPERDMGNDILKVENLSKEGYFKNVSFTVKHNDKIDFLCSNSLAITKLFDILVGKDTDFTGTFKWGTTITYSYLPQDNREYFENCDLSLVNWLKQYSKDNDEEFVRGWLGRMLFTGEESLKKASVISGGERVRCMLARMMLKSGNVLLMDEPTNHLDLESITALNKGMINFSGCILFTSHDEELTQTVANRIIEIVDNGTIDKMMTYEEYIDSKLGTLEQK
jgi:ATPase subunit of ABC transporter with duplicated ATPase domains